MVPKINKISEKLKLINDEDASHRIEMIIIDLTPPQPLITETDSIVPDTVVGKQNDKLKLVNMLIKPSNDAVSVIPIVGMGAWKDNFSSFNLQSSSRRKAFRWKDLD